MKLDLPENIKRLRTVKHMTQQQLADRIGVSHKAVSRWETGTAYPDIEILPVLAQIFGVTTDELLGVPGNRTEDLLGELYDKLLSETHNEKERLTVTREMLQKYPQNAGLTATYLRELWRAHAPAKEIREVSERLFSIEGKEFNRDARLEIKALLYDAEDDDRAAVILDEFPDDPLLDRRYRMMSRSAYREDRASYEKAFETYMLYGLGAFLIPGALFTSRCTHDGSIEDAQKTADIESARLSVINTLTGTADQSVVSGDGDPDLWFYYRMNSGLRLSCALAGLGRTDEALNVLEDAAELFARFWSVPDGTVLSFRSDALPTVRLSPTFFESSVPGNNPRKKCACCCFDGFSGTCGYADKDSLDIFFGVNIMRNILYSDEFLAFDSETGWEWFDAVRGDMRYRLCIERMKKHTEYRR